MHIAMQSFMISAHFVSHFNVQNSKMQCMGSGLDFALAKFGMAALERCVGVALLLCILYFLLLKCVFCILYFVFWIWCFKQSLGWLHWSGVWGRISYYVFCISYNVFCILYLAFCILYFVFCILYFVFCISHLTICPWLFFSTGFTGCLLLKFNIQMFHWSSTSQLT